MQIAIAKYGQETNSFSATTTTLDTFRQFGLYEGRDVLTSGMQSGPLAGLASVCAEYQFEWTAVPLIRGWAGASGVIAEETHEYFVNKIRDGLVAAGEVDAVFLDLHGAAQAEHLDDCEGDVLAVCRSVVGDEVPIVVALDHHANVTQLMCEHATAIVAHRTQPHDPFDTGVQAGRLLVRQLRGEIEPVMAFRKVPMLTHQEQFLTAPAGPMRDWFEKARQFETEAAVLSVSPCPMQPWLDITEAGWSVIVVTDSDQRRAESIADEMATFAWEHRHRFMVQESLAADVAVKEALQTEQFVVLSDTGDSVFGGAPGDSTILLRELLQAECQRDGSDDRACLVPIVDPEVVAIAFEAGEGAHLKVQVGGKIDDVFSQPVELECDVVRLGGGVIEVEVIGNASFNAGRAALLQAGRVLLAVTETEGIGGNHPVCYEQFGVDVSQAKLAVLKTASNFQYFARFDPLVIRADTDGMTMSDVVRLPWKKLARPIYPLDETAFPANG